LEKSKNQDEKKDCKSSSSSEAISNSSEISLKDNDKDLFDDNIIKNETNIPTLIKLMQEVQRNKEE
jgi:hypothetical protein